MSFDKPDLGFVVLEMVLKVLDVDGAVRRVRGGWESTGREWQYDRQRYARVNAARKSEQDAMLGYLETADCQMEFLCRQLDDPDAARCGRCDNCTGKHWNTRVSTETLDAPGNACDNQGVESPMAEHRPEPAQLPDHAAVLRCVTLPAIPTI